MCLAAWAVAQNARFPWVIATNRDEYFERAAAPLAWWRPQPDSAAILGGRDLAAGGTWLALSAEGGFALVTNVRSPEAADATLPSRGELVTASLALDARSDAALSALAQVPRNGFNLLRADLRADSGIWFGNRPPLQRRFAAGVHGLSNAALDTPWPKVTQLKRRLAAAAVAATSTESLVAAAMAALADPASAPDADLPSTGLPLARERQLSPAFIRIDGTDGRGLYGTRCSTVVVVEGPPGDRQRVHVVERRFDPRGEIAGETDLHFDIGS